MAAGGQRFYTDLAEWWPLISPVDGYADEAAYFAGLLRAAPGPVREVLELGSGGGHNAAHMKAAFAMTLVDLSEPMLDVSRRLNPECAHVRGDMRTVRLGRPFDAVFVHDAIGYMTTEADLRQALQTAFIHCRPGGMALFVPDSTRETFAEETTPGGSGGDSGRAVRFLGWTWDPDPADGWVRTDYTFLLREADGSVRSVHEAHRLGLFARADWLRLLAGVGFTPRLEREVTADARAPRDVFIALRPGSPTGRQG